ncbi:MAG: hypothetical protein GEU91_10720 [Rhizobiales bacterium]|nr:hypothetical protein [Hyphomicrobiales bacterium]
MFILVLILGLVAAAAGSVAVWFGLSITEFSLGNTLLIAGTTAFVGGLVMIAVAGAIRELRRIAEALANGPAVRFPRPGESFDPYAPGTVRPGMGAPRMPPMPPRGSPQGTGREHRPEEPKRAAATGMAEPLPELKEPSSPSLQPLAQSTAEPATDVDKPNAIPISPQELRRSPPFETPGEPSERSSERPPEAQAFGQDATDGVETVAPTAPKPPAERERASPFDAIWPPRERTSAREDTETATDDAEPGHDVDTAPPAVAASSANEPESDALPQPEEAPAETPAAAESVEPASEPPHPVSILKSGVVDGMAYTLYSDGSIEAELPTGMIRFESISELRMHLEKTG